LTAPHRSQAHVPDERGGSGRESLIYYSGGIPLQLTHSREFTSVAIGRLWGVPHLVLIMVAVLIVLWVVLNRTVQGQHIKAIGVAAESARRAGVAVDRSRIIASASAMEPSDARSAKMIRDYSEA
jgi:ribose/xylose/arabinose/galactoside ABC-type transport system permease subunit